MTPVIQDGDDRDADKGILQKLIRARTILVSEVVSDKLYRRVVTQLVLMQDDNATLPITVYVNSPGGSADSGFAIYDMLRFVKPPVRTVCTGLCASAAVLIYLAAPRERRFSLPNSRFLLHQPSTSLFGAAADIEINANEILRLREVYNKIVSDQTGRPYDQVNKDADRDFWLAAPAALEYGLIGKIVTKFDDLGKA